MCGQQWVGLSLAMSGGNSGNTFLTALTHSTQFYLYLTGCNQRPPPPQLLDSSSVWLTCWSPEPVQLGVVGNRTNKIEKRPQADISFKCKVVHLIQCDTGNKIHHRFHTGSINCFLWCVNVKQHIEWARCEEPEKNLNKSTITRWWCQTNNPAVAPCGNVFCSGCYCKCCIVCYDWRHFVELIFLGSSPCTVFKRCYLLIIMRIFTHEEWKVKVRDSMVRHERTSQKGQTSGQANWKGVIVDSHK